MKSKRLRQIIAKGYLLAAALVLSISPGWAQAHYECKGLASQTVILTPTTDGSVTWAANGKPPEEKTTYSIKGHVFTAEFSNIAKTGTYLLYVIDQLTLKGFEVVHVPSTPATSGRITCQWIAS